MTKYKTVTMSRELEACASCGGSATLEDHRLQWVVRCDKCGACVIGARAPEPCCDDDDEASDEEKDAKAEKVSNETVWDYYERSAIHRWNIKQKDACINCRSTDIRINPGTDQWSKGCKGPGGCGEYVTGYTQQEADALWILKNTPKQGEEK